ncbi:MAG: DNA/RNA non-specific endonuclease [Rikenellaceae bacterium]|nr:DNA/RNA non-specific endonuclease [Rikenellaceae bacterium]
MRRVTHILIYIILIFTVADVVASPHRRRRRARRARVAFVASTVNSDTMPTVATCVWRELPAINPADDQEFITHYTDIDSLRRRNFSMLYDHSDKLALWVAYPMHSCYLGAAGRSDAWAFDPIIPRPSQMNMSRSGFIDDNGCSTYDRGHQIPSADRTVSRQANAATFFYSNMTPQQSSLNRGLWGKLESFVRNNTPAADTLWVVTGCVLTTAEQPVPLRAAHKTHGDSITVPRAYFKVLLRSTVCGSLPSDTTAECIGFWIPNAAPASGKLTSALSVSVNHLEELTGYDFFPGLSDTAEEHLDPSVWKW